MKFPSALLIIATFFNTVHGIDDRNVYIKNSKFGGCLGFNKQGFLFVTKCRPIQTKSNEFNINNCPDATIPCVKFRWSGDNCIGVKDRQRVGIVSCRDSNQEKWERVKVGNETYKLFLRGSDYNTCLEVKSKVNTANFFLHVRVSNTCKPGLKKQEFLFIQRSLDPPVLETGSEL